MGVDLVWARIDRVWEASLGPLAEDPRPVTSGISWDSIGRSRCRAGSAAVIGRDWVLAIDPEWVAIGPVRFFPIGPMEIARVARGSVM
jgi:hypothetical protein